MKITLTFAIIVTCFLAFVTQMVFPAFTTIFALIPALALSGSIWQFITYMFLHGGIEHIFINMFVLLIFGISVEQAIGTKRFAFLYFISGIGSALLFIALTGITDTYLLGASGAVFGVLVAFAMLFPNQRLIIFPIPIPIKALYAVIAITAFELVMGIFDILPGIANFGHVGGIISGFLVMMYYRYAGGKQRAKEFREMEFAWE